LLDVTGRLCLNAGSQSHYIDSSAGRVCHVDVECSSICTTSESNLWGAVRKNIISDRYSTKTAISVRI